jgi:hypothetical protein
VNTRGTTFYESVQILAYADDTDIIGINQSAMTEAFTSSENAVKNINLLINQEQTKDMPVTRNSHASSPYLEPGLYKFQVVHKNVTYLGSDVNSNNGISLQIQKHILAANRRFYRSRKHFKHKDINYKVLIRPVITYASEAWTLYKIHELRLSLFESKVFRCIFGAKQQNGVWQKTYNHELYKTFNKPNIFNYIKVKSLAWAGNMAHMNKDTILKKIFNTKPEKVRSVGRPNLQRKDGVDQDSKTPGVNNWKNAALNRDTAS